MSMKIIRYPRDPNHVHMWCSACNMSHASVIGEGGVTVSGPDDNPSIFPSIRNNIDLGMNITPEVCHYTVSEGKYIYTDECTHTLRGKTVDMPDVPSWMLNE